ESRSAREERTDRVQDDRGGRDVARDAALPQEVDGGIAVDDHAIVRVLEADRRDELEPDPDVGAEETERLLADAGRATLLDRAERALEPAVGDHGLDRFLPALDRDRERVREEVERFG